MSQHANTPRTLSKMSDCGRNAAKCGPQNTEGTLAENWAGEMPRKIGAKTGLCRLENAALAFSENWGTYRTKILTTTLTKTETWNWAGQRRKLGCRAAEK